MKHNLLKFIWLVFVLAPFGLRAQEHEIGFDVGYGKTTVEDYNMKFVLPFSNEYANFFQFGFRYYFTPKDAIFTLKTGFKSDGLQILGWGFKFQKNTTRVLSINTMPTSQKCLKAGEHLPEEVPMN